MKWHYVAIIVLTFLSGAWTAFYFYARRRLRNDFPDGDVTDAIGHPPNRL